MNVSELYQYCNYMTNKDIRGNFTTPEQYNILLNTVNLELFKTEADKLFKKHLANQQANVTPLALISPLRDLIEIQTDFTVADGAFDVPDDYKHFLSMMVHYGGSLRNLELVTEEEFNSIRTGLSRRNIVEYPAGVERSRKIYFLPNDIDLAERFGVGTQMVYIKLPTTPYYDYCIDSDGNTIYMPDGYYVDLVASVYNLYDGDDTLIEANVTYPNYSTSPTVSSTNQLDWGEDYHPYFAHRLLEKAGIPIKEELLEQFAQLKTQNE